MRLSGSSVFGATAAEIRAGSGLSADCALADRLSGHVAFNIFSLFALSPRQKFLSQIGAGSGINPTTT
jgi:hypothetical protein